MIVDEDEDIQQQPLLNSFAQSEEINKLKDEIEVLKSHLEREKEKLYSYEKRVADLTEELAITQANLTQTFNKLNQVTNERDTFQTKLKDSINKMSWYRDKMQDQAEKIEQVESNLEILTIENDSLKKQLQQVQNELNFIKEHNILIPTKADNSRQSMIDTHQQASNQHVNEELRRLHIAMKQKEGLITKVKTIVKNE